MLRQLLSQDWKSFRRSPAFGQEVLKTVFLGLFGFMMVLYAFALGAFVPEIIEEFAPEADPFTFVGKGLLYYFLIDILIRGLMQKFPVLEIKPLLARPIKKGTLSHFVLLKSIKSFFNYFPLFFIVPYFLRNVMGAQPTMVGVNFLLVSIGLILLANFIGFAVDKFFKSKSWLAFVILGLIMGTLYLDFSGRIGLGPYLEQLYLFLVSTPITAIIPIVLAGISYYFIHQMVKGYMYLDNMGASSGNKEVSSYNFGFARYFGQPGYLMDLETKLIWRSKRSKTFLMISLVMLAYPLIFIGNASFDMMGMKIFVGLFVTGMFAMNYGQLLLSWNSPHFDLLMTRNLKIQDIFKAKYYLLAGSCVVLFTLFSVYFFIDRELFFIGAVMFLYNAGVTIYLYMILASFNSKRIDPTKGSMMNYEGIGASHFLILIPVWLIPYAIWKVADLLGNGNIGFVAIAVLGILGLVLHQPIINAITKLFFRNKYKISAAFRKV